MTNATPTPDRIAELLVHVGRAARSESAGSDLTAAQWTCLRFFARANRSTRTPSGFAAFQVTTRGTASQIVKSLEGRGLVLRRRSSRDGRSVRFDLTAAGRAMLASDPLGELVGVIAALDPDARARLLGTLSHLAAAVAGRRGAAAFGSCRDCRHFDAGRAPGYCACMDAPLGAEDIDKLCASFQPPAPPTENEGKPDARP